MRILNALASSMVAMSLMVAPAAFAGDAKVNKDEFMKSCDMDHDGMMS